MSTLAAARATETEPATRGRVSDRRERDAHQARPAYDARGQGMARLRRGARRPRGGAPRSRPRARRRADGHQDAGPGRRRGDPADPSRAAHARRDDDRLRPPELPRPLDRGGGDVVPRQALRRGRARGQDRGRDPTCPPRTGTRRRDDDAATRRDRRGRQAAVRDEGLRRDEHSDLADEVGFSRARSTTTSPRRTSCSRPSSAASSLRPQPSSVTQRSPARARAGGCGDS